MNAIIFEITKLFGEYKDRNEKLAAEYKALTEGELHKEISAIQGGKKPNQLAEILKLTVGKGLQLDNAHAENAKCSAEKMKDLFEKVNQCAVDAKKNARKAELLANKLAFLVKKAVLSAEPFAEKAKQVTENAKKCAVNTEQAALQAQRQARDAEMSNKAPFKLGMEFVK